MLGIDTRRRRSVANLLTQDDQEYVAVQYMLAATDGRWTIRSFSSIARKPNRNQSSPTIDTIDPLAKANLISYWDKFVILEK